MRTLLEIYLSWGIRKENGCLEWPWSKDKQGYGKIYYKKKVRSIHRVIAHIVYNLDLDNPKIKALHKCDNPPCFEPSHIKVGTQSLNMFQAHLRGKREHWKNTPKNSKGRFTKNGN